ncbi:cell wall-binding repeat-containing protein [Peptacetobacter hiranonis]|uniref:cell wall-binding repeat-containing protein n=1 Tax=Peptacetobacter hiranonis TaxID=89152 RepID=UPI0022E49B0A|nr:cell wall-binding repeat-containing protein [Peptacetobacter hiranonis]
MNFRKKASALALCAVLLGTTIAPVSAATHEKLVGKDRYETAAMIADQMGDYETAILVNSDKSLSDGLSASSLSGKENAPILLAKQNKLPEATAKRLEKAKKVYIIGGEKAIGKEVEAKLAGKEVIRVSGENRIETSLEIAKILGGYNKAFVVNGFKGEADAMSVAAVAAREKAPIFLTDGKDLTEYSDAKHYVIGGENMVSEEVATDLNAERIAGKDRYETNREVLNKFYNASNKLYFTRGDKLVDALTVSPLAKNDGVALVSEKSNKNVIKNKATLVQVGGVQDSVINQIFGGQTTEDKSSLTVASESLNVQLGEKVDYKTIGAVAKDIDGTDISDKIQIIGLNPDVPGDYFIKVVVKLSNGKELSRDSFICIYEYVEDAE